MLDLSARPRPNRFVVPLLAAALLAAVPAMAGPAGDGGDTPSLLSPKTAPAAARTLDVTEPRPLVAGRIVNGVPTWGLPSVVAILVQAGSGNLVTNCSGTLIGCDTVLSAAHCFYDVPNPGSYLVYTQNGGLHTLSSLSIHPDYPGFVGQEGDVAVLKLSAPVTGIRPSPINTVAKPGSGSEGVIAGYGLTEGTQDDAGIKRFGAVLTSPCTIVPDANHLCWQFLTPIGIPGADSNTCPGDSGGPLFADFGGGPLVAGITSGGTSASCLPTDNSFDADVFTYRNWIQSTGGPGVDDGACGSIAQAGEPGGTILAGGGFLDATNNEDTFAFDVPAGTSLVRVTLNGEDGSPFTPSDFDLYVKEGGTPTLNDWDCRPFLAGNYEGCEFDNPTPGTWGILVDRFSGEGDFQVSVTLFAPAGGCVEDANTMCLNDGRFAVTADFRTTPGGMQEAARAIRLTNDTGYFWFFNQDNLESFVKVLDACSFNDRFWVFAGGLTDLEVQIVVTDTQENVTNTYTNPFGTPYLTINDTDAFATCP